jgi:NTP pyrophosphatase (non-canonical NTP hydrolase)
MRQYLVEGATGAVPFFVDRTKPFVFETRTDGASTSRIPGRFSICDCVNGNNRRYSKKVWEKNLQNGSVLRESMKRNAAFGLLEHPKDGIVTLLSPISHHVTEADLKETKDITGKTIYEVHGTIELLETPEGGKLRALIEGGYNPMVSSRGYGSLEKGTDGVDNVCEDYICEGWDVVIKPSFETAELTPVRDQPVVAAESRNSLKASDQTVLAEAATKMNLKESPSTGAEITPAASAQTKTKPMEINEVRSRVSALRTAVESCPSDPNRINALREDIDSIGREVSQYRAADPAKNDWDAQKLHRELDSLSNKLGETASAPAKQAKRLSENNTKLMKVINAVAQTALTYKKKLGEALKTVTSNTKMIEELTRRGQGWQSLAETRKQKYATLEDDFNTSCEALDLMRDRYHEDVTELGRRIIVLEFKEKAQTPEIQKSLKEATRLRHIAAIRETLEGKKPVTEEGDKGKLAGAGQPKEGEEATTVKKEGQGKGTGEKGDLVAKEPGNVAHESKGGQPATASVAESKDAPKDSATADKAPATTSVAEAKILLRERDPRGITESYEMVRRLSTTAK